MRTIRRIKELVDVCNFHCNLYYSHNTPQITDKEYDEMYDFLAALEQKVGVVMSNSPTQRVGYQMSAKLAKTAHKTPLLSLNKTKDVSDLEKFQGKHFCILMHKLDGLTIELDYVDGVLVEGSTRGSGFEGEVVTSNIRTFKNVPATIPFKGTLRISGEAIIYKDDFERLNSKLADGDKYKTPRNLASGSIRQLDPKVCAERKLRFYAFNVLECSEQVEDLKSEYLEWLETLGFDVVTYRIGSSESMRQSLINAAEEMYLPIDGLVLTYNSIKYSNTFSTTSHHPLHSLAYKFYDESQETILTDVEWSVSRTGQINPVAVFNTVLIDNTDVSRASLFNVSFIRELGLNIGNRILVSKRNMIIPYIEDNLDRGMVMEIPKICPSCSEPVVLKTDGSAEVLMCTNENCPSRLLAKFTHFVSKSAMNIDGLSEATLEKFIDEGLLETFSDIYYLDHTKQFIINLDGFGQKSYDKLSANIESSRNVKLENFIVALGIPNVGRTASKTISKYFDGDWYKFEKAYIEKFDFAKLDDFGKTMNENIYKFLYEGEMEWVDLVSEMKFIKEEKTENDFKLLDGKVFVITGSLDTFKNRDELAELVSSMGGKVSGSVSKGTTYLINNDISSTTGKNKKALECGVTIISEDVFNKLIQREV